MSMDEALNTFVTESRELLQDMEESLLQIEQNPENSDLINAIFRAAHTIKGSAGLFGLDHIVSFTHVAESVLDKVRDNELPLSEDLVALFLQVCDQLGILVDLVAGNENISEDVQKQSDALAEALNTYLDKPASTAKTEKNNESCGALTEHKQPYIIEGGSTVETDNWHISLRFGSEVLRNGMDPFAFIRYLGTLGKIVNLVTLSDALPPIGDMDPEQSYLGFEIAFDSDVSKGEIEGVFEFVREDSDIRIIPPRSKITEYLDLIDNLPEEDLKLGEILVRCGTLTDTELDKALSMQRDAQGTPLGEVLQAQSMVEAPVVEAALEKQKQVKDNKAAAKDTIRVDADKLDHLINLVGELIVAGAGANLIAQNTGMPDLLEANETMSRLVEEVRDSALTLRMVQIGATFNRFNRVVRDVSRELGKDIVLKISGADTELDKTVVEKIGDPLTHLVRNAMDHGIEPADVRQARGKPAKGTVRLNAYHDSGSIVIEVSDDGGGLSRDKIFAKAVERGIVNEDQNLSDQEVYNLIFEPGFSTADNVSNLSGRGVGMDVVRRNIQALRGEVFLDSQEGQGSTVQIRLPLTLAIIDGFLVGVGHHSYVIPLDMVDECVELSAWQNNGGDGHYLNLRGEVLPYMKMRELFGVSGQAPKRENVVVVQADGKKAGLVVDRLMGEFQTVIKPLGKLFNHTRALAGFTILGSGEVALILDVANLIANTIHSERAAFEGLAEATKQAFLGLTHDRGATAR